MKTPQEIINIITTRTSELNRPLKSESTPEAITAYYKKIEEIIKTELESGYPELPGNAFMSTYALACAYGSEQGMESTVRFFDDLATLVIVALAGQQENE